jgi:hypothetical protein
MEANHGATKKAGLIIDFKVFMAGKFAPLVDVAR